MGNTKRPNFYEDDDKNKQFIYGSGEAGDLRILDDLPLSSANQSIRAAAPGTQPFPQQQLGQAAGISTVDLSIPEGEPDRLARKRKNDREYRVRCKENEKRMRCDMGTFEEENRRLKRENETLKMDNSLGNQMVQTQSKELNRLRSDFEKLKLEERKQSVLVQTLSDLLVCSAALQNEHQQLVTENLALRQNWTMNPDILPIVEENARLRFENRVLEERRKAMCEKIVNDRENNQDRHPSW